MGTGDDGELFMGGGEGSDYLAGQLVECHPVGAHERFPARLLRPVLVHALPEDHAHLGWLARPLGPAAAVYRRGWGVEEIVVNEDDLGAVIEEG